MSERTLIGVRYCGGCNPRYDRVASMTRLKKMLPEMEFVNAAAGERYDAVLVVSGCSTQCTKTDDLTVPAERLMRVNGYGDLLPVRDRLTELPRLKEAQYLSREQASGLLSGSCTDILIDEVPDLVPGERAAVRCMTFDAGEGSRDKAEALPLMLIESMFQASCVMVLAQPENAGKRAFLRGVDGARFPEVLTDWSGITVYSFLTQHDDAGDVHCGSRVFSGGNLIFAAQITISVK